MFIVMMNVVLMRMLGKTLTKVSNTVNYSKFVICRVNLFAIISLKAYFCRQILKDTPLARNKKALPILENVEITGVAAEGKALARVDNLVVFVPLGAPGDVVDIQITKKRKQHAEGRIVRFEKYADERVTPFCSHFGTCGGCQWQHLPYEAQLRYKQQQVMDNLIHLGKIELPEPRPILGSEKNQAYRNKLEFTFSNKRWRTLEEIHSGEDFVDNNALGFHIPGMFDKVLDIEKCYLQEDFSNRIRLSVKAFCEEHQYAFFDLRSQEGLMRNLIIRTASTGEKMVIVIFRQDDKEKREMLLNYLVAEFPEITSLIYIINEKCNDTIFDQDIHVFQGRDHIFEQMEDLRFKIGPKSFYQTNSEQAYRLYSVVRDFADLKGDELVYDLYTGTGTIANFLAHRCRQVIGVEYVPEAIEDAKANAQFNQLNNTLFFAGDVKDLVNKAFLEKYGHPDVLVTDPPRAGMHEDVVHTILYARPQRIVYVSCNPATQARDLNLLDAAYKVMEIQPVDMFPHTQHVENVVLLQLK